jgi:hypothetical protein
MFGMSRFPTFAGRFVRLALLMPLMASVASPLAQAEQVLTSAQEPLQLKLSTPLNSETSHYGDTFEGTLADSYRYEDKQLPAGTILKGQVHSARASMIFAMPGYVSLDVNAITLPSGASYQFDQNGKAVHSRKFNNPNAKTQKQVAKSNWPFTVVSLATSIPLRYAADMSAGAIIPISLAARMLTGEVLELGKTERAKHTEKQDPPQVRVGHGLLRGSGLPAAYYMLTLGPEANVAAGDTIPLRFDAKTLHSLFVAGSATPAMSDASGLKPGEPETQEFSDVHAKLGQASTTLPAATMQSASVNMTEAPTERH